MALLCGRPGDDAAVAVAAWRAVATSLRLAHVRLEPLGTEAAPHGVHPGRCARLVDAATRAVIGWVGEVDPAVAARAVPGLDADRRLGWLDLSLGVLCDPDAVRRASDVASVPSRYPTSDVDLALVVDSSVHVEDLKDVLRDAAGGAVRVGRVLRRLPRCRRARWPP